MVGGSWPIITNSVYRTMPQYQEKATVVQVEQLSADNIRLTFDSPEIAAAAQPGQFVMIRTGTGKDPLLRRPFSIHQTTSSGRIQVYFKVVGRGTELLAHLRTDEKISIFGPLGRGFRIIENTPVCIVGGGLGIAPMLFLAKRIRQMKKDCTEDLIILGGRDRTEVEPLIADFEQIGIRIATATDDGSFGRHGFVTEVFSVHDLPERCAVYCCGPEPMMAAMSVLCKKRHYPCQVSVESVMACGMGACLGCNRQTRDGSYAHVCLDGPVFDAEEMIWNI
jgi:dihydroorotate dehydrogenase electron transfer subunit